MKTSIKMGHNIYTSLVVGIIFCVLSATQGTLATEDERLSGPAARQLLAGWHPKHFRHTGQQLEKPEGGSDEERAPVSVSETPEASEPSEATEAEANPGPAEEEIYAPFGFGISPEEFKQTGCPIVFAAFFMSKPGGFDRPAGTRCNGCHEAPMHITFETAKITHPDACVAILTDMETDLSGIKGIEGVQVHRFYNVANHSKIGTPGLMRERMKIYHAFVKRAVKEKFNVHMALLDTDIVLVGSISNLYEKPFDYGLSARGNGNLPIQGGLQLVHADRTEGALAFLTVVLDEWEASHTSVHKGREYGFTADQSAYMNTLGDKDPVLKVAVKNKVGMLTVNKGEAGKFDILLIPGTQYNRSPGGPGSNIKKENVKVLHYKGGRKESMYVTYNALKKGYKALYALKGMT